MKRTKLNRLASIALTLVMLLTCTTFAFSAQAEDAAVPTENWTDHAATEFAGGTGTEDDPFQIATAEQMAYLQKYGSASGKYFKVTAQTLDMGAYLWVPTGDFKGVFDGNGCVIENVVITSATSDRAGLFGRLMDPAEVKDLTLKVSINVTYAFMTGGLAGAVYQNAKVSNVAVYADINVSEAKSALIGGAVGYLTGHKSTLENVTVYGSVSATATGENHNPYVAGVIGRLNRGSAGDSITMKNLVNHADVILTSARKDSRVHVGGVAGVISADAGSAYTFLQCANFGTLTVSDAINHTSSIGGILSGCGDGKGSDQTVTMEACLNAGAIVNNSEKFGDWNGSMIGSAYGSQSKLSLIGCVSSDKAPLVGETTRFESITTNGSAAAVSLTTLDGARVRMDTDGDTSGIRFDNTVSKTAIDAIRESSDVKLEIGTLIAPTANIVAVNGTDDLISALEAKGEDTYVKVVYPNGAWLKDGDNYEFSGAIGRMNKENYELAFSAVAYLTLTTENGSVTLYADNGVANGTMNAARTRTIKAVATMALNDTEANYTEKQKAVLQIFSSYTNTTN